MIPDPPEEARRVCKAWLRRRQVRASKQNIRRLLDYVNGMLEHSGDMEDANKPDWMSTTYYWLQQIDGHRLEGQVAAEQQRATRRRERSRSR